MAAGGDVLVVVGAEAKEVAELVVAATEALIRIEAPETARTSYAPFDAPVTVLEPVFLYALVRWTTRRPSVVRIARG